jgi:hypothetical protein
MRSKREMMRCIERWDEAEVKPEQADVQTLTGRRARKQRRRTACLSGVSVV